MACDQIIDSYEGSDDTDVIFTGVGRYIGQAFTMGDTPHDVCGAKFNVAIENNGGTYIDVTAKIYACTGTPGTDGMITGAALATSDTIRFTSTVTTWTTFTFSSPYTLNASTNYCIVCMCTAIDGAMSMGATTDITTPTHGGNTCFDILFGDDYNTNDTNFYMYYYSPDEYIKRINIENKKPSYRLTPENKKPTYRLTPENKKPTYRLETTNNMTTDRILFPELGLYPSDALYPGTVTNIKIRISEGSNITIRISEGS